MKHVVFYSAAFLLLITAAIATLEVVLQVSQLALAYDSPASYSTSSTEAKTKILIIGESMVYGHGVNEQDSFPSQLQGMLDAANPNQYSVINAGKKAETSTSTIKRVTDYFNNSAPEFTIVMMGINDLIDVRTYESLSSNSLVHRWLLTPRFLILSFYSIKDLLFGGTGNFFNDPVAEASYKAIATEDLLKIAENKHLKKQYENASLLAKEYVRRRPLEDNGYNWLERLNNETGEAYKNVEMYKTLRRNYRSLIRLALRSGSKLILMQYPLRDLNFLKELVSPITQPVVFVPNQENFKAAIREKGEAAVFSDKFAGDFGHCTRLGYRLLAESAFSALLKASN
ncbi:MAG: hypothetical protein HRT45_02745 [Bdellovibrionales bacterium]|nr:hypothetical protein [Bdellovibrionales bacterium]